MSGYLWPANYGRHSSGIYVINSFFSKDKVSVLYVYLCPIKRPTMCPSLNTLLYLVCATQSKEHSWFVLGMDRLFKKEAQKKMHQAVDTHDTCK